jgi:pimeloyl-ACP methyl ester carboxylesterase
MKKIVFMALAILLAANIFAQTAAANYSVALNKFVKFYNADKADSVFTMFSPEMKTAEPLDKFVSTTAQLKQQLGTLDKTEFVKFAQPFAIYRAKFKNGTFLLNLALNDQDKITGLLLKPQDDLTTNTTTVDPSVTESPIALKTMAGTIAGTLTMPKTVSGKIPVVLIIGAAGSVDRDGNCKNPPLNANTYQLLAGALGKAGIASVRYDKRMVGQSVSADKENQLRIEDYVDDATSLIGMLNDDGRFSKIILAGHGQGALVSMMATADQPIKGLISLEGAGTPADKMLTDQMKSQPSYLGDEFKAMLDTLRKGKITDNIDPALYAIARPTIQPFLMSWCRYDPLREIKKNKMPILLIQGTTDLLVPVTEGQKLKNAKSNATLALIRGMNYVLKDAPQDKDPNLATYQNPTLPLNQEMVTTVVTFINGL